MLLCVTFSVASHDNGEAPHGGNPPLHAIDTMRAFKEDHHAPEPLSSVSATTCISGFASGYPCSNIDLLAFMPLSEIGGGEGSDIWGWTDSETGKEYAIMGRSNGTSFVDISDPVNPVYLGDLPPHSSNSSWRDIKVYADHAYIVTEANNSGLQVFDLAMLRTVTSPPQTFSETNWFGGFLSAHNIVINETTGFAYAVGTNNGDCNQGMYFIDIRDPANPAAAGCFAADGYTHDAQCVLYEGPDSSYQGREICFNYNEDTLTIVDVTNKSAPVQLSRTDYVGRHYTHQGWLTDDHRYLLMDDELDERHVSAITKTRTFIWDVADLNAPASMGFYEAPVGSIDHNQYIKGRYSYQANYQAGLRILDISDVANANLSEVAFFDIYPAGDATEFNGAWSNFPFFDSGTVIVSGIEQGLFILRPTIAPFSVNIDVDPWSVLNIIKPNTDDPITLVVLGSAGFNVLEIDSASLKLGPGEAPTTTSAPWLGYFDDNATGHLDAAYGFNTQDTGIACYDTEVNLTGVTTGGDLFEATDSIDASDCATGVCHP